MIQTMIKSQEIPHMGYTDEFNLTKLTQYRKNLSPQKVSILAFFIKATSLAMQEYPIVNASWKDLAKGEVTIWASHNLGVAMDTPRGLVVPVIRNCQDKSLVAIQNDLNELKEIAAAGKLGEQHLTGATFSISNIGSLGGGTYMNPLIVPPQAAIGAMGALQTLPRFDKDGNVEAAKIMNISWAGDHRMIDGATMARFSNRCKEFLEDPVQMLIAMK
jgi:2-oxoisovalerate dehydrogenase E2 component (dihydrolipoyl transacylase)